MELRVRDIVLTINKNGLRLRRRKAPTSAGFRRTYLTDPSEDPKVTWRYEYGAETGSDEDDERHGPVLTFRERADRLGVKDEVVRMIERGVHGDDLHVILTITERNAQ
ncbi:hypothetical protein ACCC98_06745 [Rhizobium pisi]|uniref:hypothetical protein n=1 Tax=Rhizobium pisi TaxID=574561 RepID=UPI0039B0960E